MSNSPSCIYLTLRTDAPEVQFAVYANENVVSERVWQADRMLAKDIFSQISLLLEEAGHDWSQLDGIVVFRGPGSFTGLRIGVSVANGLAYALDIPVVGTTGEQWRVDGWQRLARAENDHIVQPEYGALPHITAPRK